MSPNFKTAIEFTLPWEVGREKDGSLHKDGGYTNDPVDWGGETKWGISKRSHPQIDIKNLTLEAALDIYRKEYYDIYLGRHPSVDLDSSPRALACVLFDSGVNIGVGGAHYFYTQSLKEKDPVKNILSLREQRYREIVKAKPDQQRFYKGWIARMNDLKKLVDIINTEDQKVVEAPSWKIFDPK